MEEITVYYAVAWQLIAAVAPYAIKGVGQLLGVGKPNKEDYMPDTTYMDKYIANIRGRQSGREVYHQAMQPALRTIGAQGRKMQRQIGYGVEKAGLTGSGIEAQQRLSAGKTTLTAMQEASEKATAAQISESRRLGEKADAMTLQKEAAISQGEKAFDSAKAAFEQEKKANLLGGVAAVAGAGISQYGAGTEAFETAKAAGLTTGTRSEFMGAAKTAGFTDPAKYAQQKTRERGIEEGIGFLKEDIVTGLKNLGITDEKISTLGSKNLESYSAILTDPNVSEARKKELMDALEKLLKR